MSVYFVHNGYCGWSYGTPSNPQLISVEDAAKIMQLAKLSSEQVSQTVPAAQYASSGDPLFAATNGNRFLCFADITQCTDSESEKINAPLQISWPAP